MHDVNSYIIYVDPAVEPIHSSAKASEQIQSVGRGGGEVVHYLCKQYRASLFSVLSGSFAPTAKKRQSRDINIVLRHPRHSR